MIEQTIRTLKELDRKYREGKLSGNIVIQVNYFKGGVTSGSETEYRTIKHENEKKNN